ncbi:hypothetical protein CQW23_07824 [Capsicum baccatum]|uniref:Uncharacterized protein n=1 Tax=Capsicum baccatum TaxID=33114 RepID=A0A2G2X771_CAPBA|nr:hypothetical protein CQW23_07824 [Capsicum baccatum]
MKLETSMAQSPIENSRKQDDRDFNRREWVLRLKLAEKTQIQEDFQLLILEVSEKMQNLLDQIFPFLALFLPLDEIDPSTYSFTTALKAWGWLLAVDGGDDDATTGGVASPVAGSGGEVGGHGWCSGDASKGRATGERDDRRWERQH